MIRDDAPRPPLKWPGGERLAPVVGRGARARATVAPRAPPSLRRRGDEAVVVAAAGRRRRRRRAVAVVRARASPRRRRPMSPALALPTARRRALRRAAPRRPRRPPPRGCAVGGGVVVASSAGDISPAPPPPSPGRRRDDPRPAAVARRLGADAVAAPRGTTAAPIASALDALEYRRRRRSRWPARSRQCRCSRPELGARRPTAGAARRQDASESASPRRRQAARRVPPPPLPFACRDGGGKSVGRPSGGLTAAARASWPRCSNRSSRTSRSSHRRGRDPSSRTGPASRTPRAQLVSGSSPSIAPTRAALGGEAFRRACSPARAEGQRVQAVAVRAGTARRSRRSSSRAVTEGRTRSRRRSRAASTASRRSDGTRRRACSSRALVEPGRCAPATAREPPCPRPPLRLHRPPPGSPTAYASAAWGAAQPAARARSAVDAVAGLCRPPARHALPSARARRTIRRAVGSLKSARAVVSAARTATAPTRAPRRAGRPAAPAQRDAPPAREDFSPTCSPPPPSARAPAAELRGHEGTRRRTSTPSTRARGGATRRRCASGSRSWPPRCARCSTTPTRAPSAPQWARRPPRAVLPNGHATATPTATASRKRDVADGGASTAADREPVGRRPQAPCSTGAPSPECAARERAHRARRRPRPGGGR